MKNFLVEDIIVGQAPDAKYVCTMDLIMRDSSLFVCLAIDLVWQVSNISIINVSVFYPDPNHKWLSLAFSYLQGYV